MIRSRKVLLLFVVLLFVPAACQPNEQINKALTQIVLTGFSSTPTLTPAPFPTLTVENTPSPENTFNLSYEDQFKIFDELWNIINDVYVYTDFNGVDWDATYEAYRQKLEAGLSDQEFYLAMDEMVYSLGDDHSVFLSPEQVAEEEAEYAGNFDYVGIGIWAGSVPERNRAVIYLVFPNSPAEEGGLQSHDSILSVDGGPILDEEGYMNDSLLGLEGTEVTITVQTPGEEPRELVLIRGQITSSIPVYYELMISPEGKQIGYILIPGFSDITVNERVDDALKALNADEPLDGLILDNRINTGGFDTVMKGVLRRYVDGLVGHFVNREREEALMVKAGDINGSTTVPLVVLVGYDTVSFGEIFSGILQDLGRAYLIGETTDGNVETLWGYDFDDGSRAWIAHDTFRPINNPGSDWEKNGIIPALTILSQWDLVTFDTDPVINAALEYFDNH